MSGLLVPYGFPTTEAGGTEGLGKLVNTVTLTQATPNGTSGTAAQIATDVAQALQAGGCSVIGLLRYTK